MSSAGVYDWHASRVFRGPTKLSVPSRWKAWRDKQREVDVPSWRDYVVASNEWSPQRWNLVWFLLSVMLIGYGTFSLSLVLMP